MKYTINGYSQEKLIENDIDLSTSLILRVIADMYTSNSNSLEYKIIDNDKYMWCTYRYLVKQIPIIGTDKTLKRKIETLVEKKILKKIVLPERNGVKGNYLYITLGENYSLLMEYTPQDKKDLGTKCPEGRDKMSSPLGTKCPNKDSSISDYSIIDSLREREEEEPKDDPEKEKAPESQNIGMYYQAIRMLLSGYSLNHEKIARYGKSIERIKAVLKFAKENNKAEGWITEAIRDDYKLEVYKKPEKKIKDIGKQQHEVNTDNEKLYEMLGI